MSWHRARLVVAAAPVLPAGVAAAWTPLRQTLPNVDVALVLVLVVTAFGATRSRLAVVAAAASAALGFAFFDTAPFEHWTVSRQPDLETLAVLVVVGLITGELAVRWSFQRASVLAGGGDLGRVRDAAAMVASGEELVVVIGAVAEELIRLLGLKDCVYEAEERGVNMATVARDGTVTPVGQPAMGAVADRVHRARSGNWNDVALPVWGFGQVLGCFVLSPTVGVPLNPERLVVAVTLADQVGSALMVQAPPTGRQPPGDQPEGTEAAPPLAPTLRVVR
jgi:K+-sensing histidine kinase KdpD